MRKILVQEIMKNIKRHAFTDDEVIAVIKLERIEGLQWISLNSIEKVLKKRLNTILKDVSEKEVKTK